MYSTPSDGMLDSCHRSAKYPCGGTHRVTLTDIARNRLIFQTKHQHNLYNVAHVTRLFGYDARKDSGMRKQKLQRKSIGRITIDRAAIEAALAEDAPRGDVTTEATIPPAARARARLVARQNLVLAGIDLFKAVFLIKDPGAKVVKKFRDGDSVPKGAVAATVSANARAALIAERVALNYLQRLSGVATLARQYVDAVEGTGATILDTRKTTPGWRDLEKYAVRCGGAQNHRRDLSEMALIKDNHIAAAGGITVAVRRVREKVGRRGFIEVEAATLADVREALAAGADRIMLDNMPPAMTRKAVFTVRGGAETEVSGNITLKNIKAYANTGADFISVGALTHSAPAADFSLIITES